MDNNCSNTNSNKPKPGSAGGRARALNSRQEAIDRYLANPSICQYCNEIMLPEPWKKGIISALKEKKFCSSSCFAKANNAKRKVTKNYTDKPTSTCEVCGLEAPNTPHRGGFKTRKRCEICKDLRSLVCVLPLGGQKGKYNKSPIIPYPKSAKQKILDGRKKGEYFASCKDYFSARSSIAKHARKTYLTSDSPLECLLCKYDVHVEICHIKSVMEFDDEALILEDINNLKNLVALCRNHHWEFDNGILSMVDLKLKKE